MKQCLPKALPWEKGFGRKSYNSSYSNPTAITSH